MNIQKHIAGLALFIFIVSSSIYLYAFVAAPLRMIPPIPLVAPAARSVSTASPFVGHRAQLISLDFNTLTSYTTLTLRRESNAPAPGKLWVNTTFFVPESPGRRWLSGAAEISDPFANGGSEASLTIVGGFNGSVSSIVAPRSGYYALITVSTVSALDAERRGEEAAANLKTAVPVLVQVEQPKGRYRSSSSPIVK